MKTYRDTLDFLLQHWLQLDALFTRERFADHSAETVTSVLDTCERLAREKGWQAFLSVKHAKDGGVVQAFDPDRTGDLVAEQWGRFDGHVFIMAAGIVVRKIAALLKGKTQDPAVVVCDEKGRFAVSLLSGHIGGANRLAAVVAELRKNL